MNTKSKFQRSGPNVMRDVDPEGIENRSVKKLKKKKQ